MNRIMKVISGGQTGVDRAALDVAIVLEIPHGGWVPKGRIAEDGTIPDKYQVKEMPTEDYASRTEQNVIDADGTLIISRGMLTGGSLLTREFAIKHKKPWHHADIGKTGAFEATRSVRLWLVRHKIRVLNVAGPRASTDPEIFKHASRLLKTIFYLDAIESEMPDPEKAVLQWPLTVEEAVSRLISELSLKDKTVMARMEPAALASLNPSLGEYIRNRFGLSGGNETLMKDCRAKSGQDGLPEADASAFIISFLWKRLQESHRLRVTK